MWWNDPALTNWDISYSLPTSPFLFVTEYIPSAAAVLSFWVRAAWDSSQNTSTAHLCADGMCCSMLGLVTVSVCAWGNSLSQTKRQTSVSSQLSRSRSVQLQLSFLYLYFSPGVSFPSHSHLIHLSLCCSLSGSPPIPLSLPPLSPSSPSSSSFM